MAFWRMPFLVTALCGIAVSTGWADEASSIFACRDWIKTQKRMADGVLRMREFRAEIKVIYEGNGRLSNPPVRDGVTALLRAVTGGTDAEQARAVKQLNEACKEVIRRNPSRF